MYKKSFLRKNRRNLENNEDRIFLARLTLIFSYIFNYYLKPVVGYTAYTVTSRTSLNLYVLCLYSEKIVPP